jgi:signal transduction histidine kinase/DNA-binding NarL/FixJ family response regulator
MTVFNTQMHIITFLICLVELVFFSYQIVYYLSRPSDKKRKYYLILLYLLLQNNIISGLLPDKNMSLNLIVQSILSYGVSFAMVMYIPYYFYKAYELTRLKFHAYYGTFFFLLGPYVACFAIPYVITGNLQVSVRLAMIIPFFYAVTLLIYLIRAIKAKNIENPDPDSKRELRGAFIAVVFFILLPVQAFFKNELDSFLAPIINFQDGSQVVEVLVTNSSLLVFTILFIRSTVRQSKAEYEKLLESEKKLQELNSELTIKVKERTIELELANEKRTNAFINLAHETKTPLTLMMNYLDAYIRKYAQPENEELKLLKRQMDNLAKDINNFFDMEKIHKGISLYDHSYVTDFSKILSDSIELFKIYASKKNIIVNSSISEDIFVKADPSALCRIINNIIENAIKYTSNNGSINVELSIKENQVCFVVNDNGIGIPTDLHGRIFEPYYQINSEKANFQGMGLGLPIVKKIIHELEGNITLKSSIGDSHGTDVIIKLPLHGKLDDDLVMEFSEDNDISSFDVKEQLNITEKVFDPTKATIMVVEDNVALLTNMVEYLEKSYNVCFAQNGEIAIEKLKTVNRLDLIVSDLMMDNGDGYFLYQNILNSPKWGHTPFIFLTAKNTTADRLQGLTLGVIDYICKPISFVELEMRIETILKNLVKNRNAFITHAYHSMMNGSEIVRPEEQSINVFESNCAKYKLTTAEIAVVRLLVSGRMYKEIANTLCRSEDTIKSHVRNSYVKVGVNNKLELVKKLEERNAVQ